MQRSLKAVAVLEVMWDWRAMTSEAGYREQAPPWFVVNPHNFTGRRLYDLLGHSDFIVTNACPDLVSGPNERGTPNKTWLRTNLQTIYRRWPFPLLLVCGRVAEATFERIWLAGCHEPPNPVRVVYMPHPAARMWTAAGLAHCKDVIRNGLVDTTVGLDYSPVDSPCSKQSPITLFEK